jgi:Concanavalin A-like lectin/glucanases superfamily
MIVPLSKLFSNFRASRYCAIPRIDANLVSAALLLCLGSLCLQAYTNQKGCTPPPSGLVSWWPGDGNANDIIGPNHGQLFGGATFVGGFVGEAFKFDGIDGYFQSGTLDLPVGAADRTLEMWVKLDSILPPDVPTSAYFESFFAGYGDFGSGSSTFQIESEYEPPYGNALIWSQWFDQLVGPRLSEGEASATNRGWHHVAVTSTTSNNIGVVLFLDGVPVARRQNFQINTSGGSIFFMGRIPGPLGDIRRMHGELDEVSIYNRVLTPQEIAAIFAAGTAGKCKP